MSPWRQVSLLAKREFVERGRNKGFIIAMVIIVVVIVAIGPVFSALTDGEPEATKVGLVGSAPPGFEKVLIAHGSLVEIEIDIVHYQSRTQAEGALAEGEADAVLIEGAEVLFHDRVSARLAALIQGSVDVTVKRSALESLGLSVQEIAALQSPVPVTVSTVEVIDDPQDNARQTAAFIGALTLYIAIVMFGQFVAMGTVEEKQSRVVEVVLSRVRPWQILVGKVAGVGVLGLVQLTILAAAAYVSAQFADLPGIDIAAIGIPVIASVFFWFMIGYTFYAFLYAAVGSTVSRMEDLQGAIWLPIVLVLPGYFLSIFALENPDDIVAKIGSMTPMWAPFVMPVRIAAGAVEPWEVVVAIVGSVLGAIALVWIGSRVYRGALLRTGTKVKLTDAWRAAGE